MKAPIQAVKHYVQQSLATVTGGTLNNFVLADALARDAAQTSVSVIEGSVIKAIYIEMWIRSSEVSPGTVLATFVKVPDRAIPTFVDMTALHDYTNKKNVFYHTQGLTNDADANGIAFVRGWFKIPKGKQRMGLGDRLILCIASQAAIDNVICGFATYKEYA